jgi:hypothetical protein
MRILLGYLFLLAGLAACTYREDDVSDHRQARSLIGTKYKIVQDIRAYGVRPHSRADAEYVVITAPPGFSGPEVAFEETVHAGAEITVLRVLKTNNLLDNPYILIVQLDDAHLHTNLPVKLELLGNNSGLAVAPAIALNALLAASSA